jgi:signal transduction histidine kinase/type II secretory pathway pseudopilin PulG
VRLDGLRLQLLGLFVLPLTLVVLVVAVLATGVHRRAMRGLVAERDERAAASAAAAIDEALRARIALLDLAASAWSDEGRLPEAEAAQTSLDQSFPGGYSVYLDDGTLVSGPGLPAEREQLPRDLLRSDGTRVETAEVGGEEMVYIAGRSSAAKAVGAVSLPELVRRAAPAITSGGTAGRTYLVGPGPSLLVALGDVQPADIADHPGVAAVLRGERGSSFVQASDGEHVVAFAPITSAGWGLVIEEAWENVTSSVLNLSLIAPFSLVPILLIALIGLWFGARRVIEPLRSLDEAASELPSGDTSLIEEPVGGIAEIEQLRASLVRMARRVQEAQSALRGYIAVITNAQEEERRRVARELHDESIQHWIALDHRLQLVTKQLRERGAPEVDQLSELRHEVEEGIRELRRLSRGLRPIYLEDLGLVPAIEMFARDAEENLGIDVNCEHSGSAVRLKPEAELAIYRLVQESLTNIGRHAQAGGVKIRLVFSEDRLVARVVDDGIGFRVPERIEDLAANGHFGLMGMKERAEGLGADLKIHSEPGIGTTVQLTVPLKANLLA